MVIYFNYGNVLIINQHRCQQTFVSEILTIRKQGEVELKKQF